MILLQGILKAQDEKVDCKSPVKRLGRILSTRSAKVSVRKQEAGPRSPTRKKRLWSPVKGRGENQKLILKKKGCSDDFDLSQAIEIWLPVEISACVLTYLGVGAFTNISCVSHSWKEMSSSEILWRECFRTRFGLNLREEQQRLRQRSQSQTLELSFATRTSARETSQVAPLSPRPRVVIRRIPSAVLSQGDLDLSSREANAYPHRISLSKSSIKTWRERFRRRLASPIVGDAIEVSWHGKFRLESCEMHTGCAWWAAFVVDKLKLHDEGSDEWWFKVTFPGWQGRWDEWVPRERLRWPIKSLDPKFQGSIRARDQVEVWCSSKNVPGAWLEANVIRVKNNKYLIGRARTQNGNPIWVERHRIRLSHKNKSPTQRVSIQWGQRLSLRQALLARLGFRSSRNSTQTNNNNHGPLPAFVGRGYVDAEDLSDEFE